MYIANREMIRELLRVIAQQITSVELSVSIHVFTPEPLGGGYAVNVAVFDNQLKEDSFYVTLDYRHVEPDTFVTWFKRHLIQTYSDHQKLGITGQMISRTDWT